MSLELAAKHLAAHGRGPDTLLVHMAPSEVHGLQALANAHGGSLGRNPSTGLPEAGFLSSILPTLIGAGLAYATGGASLGAEMGLAGVSNAALIGGGVGALQTMRTGDLGKGIMAGLGAYGGAGLEGAADKAGMFGNNPSPMQGPQVAAAPDLSAAAQTNPSGLPTSGPDYQMTPSQMASQAPSTPMLDDTYNPEIRQGAPSTGDFLKQNWKYGLAAAAPTVMDAMQPNHNIPSQQPGTIRPYTFNAGAQHPANMVGAKYAPGQDTSERMWFQPQFTAQTPYPASQGMAAGGPVEQMSNNDAIGANTMYPMANMTTSSFATPYQTPVASNMIAPSGGVSVDQSSGELNPQGTRLAGGGLAFAGGGSTLGGYSDGGRMLKGPGDGMSDNIPAQIGAKQPARLADGEFVVPADVVSHLGNGSSDAGAKQLYAMMDKIRQARTGRKAQGKQINPQKYMPA